MKAAVLLILLILLILLSITSIATVFKANSVIQFADSIIIAQHEEIQEWQIRYMRTDRKRIKLEEKIRELEKRGYDVK